MVVPATHLIYDVPRRGQNGGHLSSSTNLCILISNLVVKEGIQLTNRKQIQIAIIVERVFCINGNLCWQSPVGCAAISGWITENMQAYPSQQHETADPHLDGVTF